MQDEHIMTYKGWCHSSWVLIQDKKKYTRNSVQNVVQFCKNPIKQTNKKHNHSIILPLRHRHSEKTGISILSMTAKCALIIFPFTFQTLKDHLIHLSVACVRKYLVKRYTVLLLCIKIDEMMQLGCPHLPGSDQIIQQTGAMQAWLHTSWTHTWGGNHGDIFSLQLF